MANDIPPPDPDPLAPNPFGDEPVELPVTDVLDLHSFPAADARFAFEAWLEAARNKGLFHLRVIHGKGIGAQREMVRKVLERTAFVQSFQSAPENAGGWGATLITLKTK